MLVVYTVYGILITRELVIIHTSSWLEVIHIQKYKIIVSTH